MGSRRGMTLRERIHPRSQFGGLRCPVSDPKTCCLTQTARNSCLKIAMQKSHWILTWFCGNSNGSGFFFLQVVSTCNQDVVSLQTNSKVDSGSQTLWLKVLNESRLHVQKQKRLYCTDNTLDPPPFHFASHTTATV